MSLDIDFDFLSLKVVKCDDIKLMKFEWGFKVTLISHMEEIWCNDCRSEHKANQDHMNSNSLLTSNTSFT